jgi:hypothetical protein
MKVSTISSQGRPDIVALSANVANVSTKIFTMTVPRGTVFDIENQTKVKGVPMKGFHIILDLNKADGSRISGASIIKLRSKNPAAEDAKTHRALPYAIWREISSALQRNDDYKATIAGSTDLDASILRFKELSQFIVEVDGPDVVDWTKSYLQFDVGEFN